MSKTRWSVLSLALVALLFGVAGQAAAVPVTIINFGFELPVESDGSFSTTANAAVGWSHDATAGVWNPSASQAYGGVAPEGSNIAYSNSGPLSQTLTTLLTPNTTYTLQVLVGNRQDVTGFPGYQIQLLAGSTILSQCVTCVTPLEGVFAPVTVTFTSGSSVTPGQFLGIVLDSDGIQTNWDNVRLDAVASVPAVPEPSTLLLLGSGLVAVVGWNNRRRRKSAL